MRTTVPFGLICQRVRTVDSWTALAASACARAAVGTPIERGTISTTPIAGRAASAGGASRSSRSRNALGRSVISVGASRRWYSPSQTWRTR